MDEISAASYPFALLELVDELDEKLDLPDGFTGLLFVEPQTLAEVKKFATSDYRKDKKLDVSDMIFKVIDVYCVRLYGVFFHYSKRPAVVGYWHLTGVGISHLLTQYLNPHVRDALLVGSYDRALIGDNSLDLPKPTYLLETPPSLVIEERIVSLLKRIPAFEAPVTSISPKRALNGDRIIPSISASDVYLFSTGRASLYRLHNYLSTFNCNEYKSVAFGEISQTTLDILGESGAGYEHFVQGDEKDLINLEELCKSEAAAGRRVQALYVEFPSITCLVNVDLEQLRKLADKYEFVLVVDHTFGGFANVDLMAIADVLATCLTVAFGGDADTMGGSLVLNADSQTAYRKLKPLMESNWHNELFAGDAVVLEQRSSNYLERSDIMNRNAESVATFLQSKMNDPDSSVTKVNYPKLSESRSNFELYMRGSKGYFTPGYGCLLTVDFDEPEHAIAFYDRLRTGLKQHSNAHATSVKLCNNEAMLENLYEKDETDEVHGWDNNRIRVVVGLENTDELMGSVQQALDFADDKKALRNIISQIIRV